MPDFRPFLVVTNWALMVHIVVTHVENPPKRKNQHLKPLLFCKNLGFGGCCVQWGLLGHLFGAQNVFWPLGDLGWVFLLLVVVVLLVFVLVIRLFLVCFGVLCCCCCFFAVVDLLLLICCFSCCCCCCCCLID